MHANAKHVETFAINVLRRHGARTTPLRKRAIRAIFPEPPPFHDGNELVVAFERKALDHHPGAQLMLEGGPFYRSLLDGALNAGHTTLAYTPVVEPMPDAPAEPLFQRGTGARWTVGETSNDPLAVFNFAISYQSVVTSDDLVSVAFDPVLERFRDPRIVASLHSVWSETLPENPGDWTVNDVADLEELLPSVLQELDARTRRKVARARRNTQRHLDQEIQAIEDYYRALIAEEREVLNRVSRTSPNDANQHQKRIQRFQLDWKRRVAEETRHHQCRVNVRLINAAIVYMPRTVVVIEDRALEAPVSCRFNHFLGSLDGAVCAQTGTELGPWRIDADGRWVSGAELSSDTDGNGEEAGGVGESAGGNGENAGGEASHASSDVSDNEEVSP